MNNNLTYKEAIKAAVSYAGLSNDDPHCTDILYRDGMYELTVCTIFQRYDFYVDGISGEVCGINAEPVLDVEDACGRIVA